MSQTQNWPTYNTPDDLVAIEATDLDERDLPASTYDVLATAAQRWPDRTALRFLHSGAEYLTPTDRTFAEVFAQANATARILRDVGVGRHDVSVFLSKNCVDYIPALLGAQAAGIVAPINPALAVAHVADMLRNVDPLVLFAGGPEVDEAGWAAAVQLAGELPTVRLVLVLGSGGDDGELPTEGLREGVTAARLSARTAEIGVAAEIPTDQRPQASDVAAFIHTGGTTGLPKLAVHTHGMQVTNAWLLAIDGKLDPERPALAALPLFHVNALVLTMLAPMLRGQAIVWGGPDGFRDLGLYGNFWKIVEHFGISTFSAVPTVYQVLATIPVESDISSLQFAVVGAAALPQQVQRAFESHTGVPLCEGYGLTEATCAVARSFPEVPRPGSVGQRLPYVHLRIVDPDDRARTLPIGSVGEVCVRGPIVFPGYAVFDGGSEGFSLSTSDLDDEGWLYTGDLGKLDDDGFLYLTGRAKDVIIRGGHNIDPGMIEEVLRTHPGVVDACAVGRPDEKSGEVPVCFVVTSLPKDEAPEQLLAFAAENVPEPAAVPKAIIVVDMIPMTSLGKPDRNALRAQLEG